MRALVVADVHANLSAFEAVIVAAAAAGAIDAVWSLGDIVGYGPEPSACIELLRRYPHVAIAGNHDLATIGRLSTADFNPPGRAAIEWTAGVLGTAERQYLAALPSVAQAGEFTLVHGSLVDPVWEYLVSPTEATAHLERQETACGLVGHSHLPLAFFETAAGSSGGRQDEDAIVSLTGARFVANVGGLGQPRDGDPRAAYGIVDTEAGELRFHRVAYDIGRTQAAMRAVGLPRYLIERLDFGR